MASNQTRDAPSRRHFIVRCTDLNKQNTLDAGMGELVLFENSTDWSDMCKDHWALIGYLQYGDVLATARQPLILHVSTVHGVLSIYGVLLHHLNAQ